MRTGLPSSSFGAQDCCLRVGVAKLVLLSDFWFCKYFLLLVISVLPFFFFSLNDIFGKSSIFGISRLDLEATFGERCPGRKIEGHLSIQITMVRCPETPVASHLSQKVSCMQPSVTPLLNGDLQPRLQAPYHSNLYGKVSWDLASTTPFAKSSKSENTENAWFTEYVVKWTKEKNK